jgi:hypothetical protein
MKKLALVTLSSLLVSTAAFAQDQAAVCHMLSARAAMVGDVNAQPMPGMPDVIRVPVTADMAKQLSANWPAGTPANGATLEVHKDGKVMFSGQDVTAATTTLCVNMPKEETPAAAEHPHKAAKTKHKSAKTASPHKKAKHKTASAPGEMPAAAEPPVTQQAVPAPAEMPAMKADESAAVPAPAMPAPVKAAPPALEAPAGNNPFAAEPPAATAPPMPPAANPPMNVGKPMGQQGASQPSEGGKPAWPAPNAQ